MERQPATTRDALRDLAVASSLQLGDRGRFFELRDGAKHLPHQDGGRCVFGEMVRCAGGRQLNATFPQVMMAGELHRQITGEPVRALDQDGGVCGARRRRPSVSKRQRSIRPLFEHGF